MASLIAAGATLAASQFMQPAYEATATVAITSPRYLLQFDPRIETVGAAQLDDQAFLALAESDAVLAQLLASPPLAPVRARIGTLDNLRREVVKANPGLDSSLVLLTVTDSDPARAAEVANTWAELFVAHVNEVYGQDQQTQAFFDNQLAVALERLNQAQAEAVAYQAVNPANVISTTLTSRLNTLTGYLNAQQSLELVIQDTASLRARLAGQDPQALTGLGDDLAALLLEVNSLGSPAAEADSSGTRPTLPIQLQLPGGVTSLSGRTIGEQFAYLGELEAALKTKAVDLQAAAEALQPEILSLQERLMAAETKAERLDQESNLAQEAYTAVARKAEEARIAAASDSGEVSLASRASAPSRPVRPRVVLYTALAAGAGLTLAVSLAFLFEYLDDSIRLPEQAAELLSLPVLGSVKRMRGRRTDRRPEALAEPRSPASEAFRALRTSLQFSGADRPPRTLLVTSPGPGEGKSTIAANLAVVMAQAGLKVVLVDCDLRWPSLHDAFACGNDQGLTTALIHPVDSPAAYLQTTSVAGLQLLTAGPLPPDPAELAGSERLKHVLAQLETEADVVLLDSSPVAAVADAAVLASRVAGVVLVIDAGRTRTAAAKQALATLAQVGARVVGLVINRVSGHNAYGRYYRDNAERASSGAGG